MFPVRFNKTRVVHIGQKRKRILSKRVRLNNSDSTYLGTSSLVMCVRRRNGNLPWRSVHCPSGGISGSSAAEFTAGSAEYRSVGSPAAESEVERIAGSE